MTLPVLRSDDGWWLRTTDGVVRIDTAATTTAELLADRDSVLRARDTASATPMPMLMAEAELSVRSPVTVPCRVLAQMTNLASHVADAGMDPATVPLTFFRKSSGSISDPEADIVTAHGAGTYMQVGETRHRWEFQLQDAEAAGHFATVGELIPLIARWVESVPHGELELLRVAEYTFQAAVANQWRRRNVFLLGDAPHLTPPFIGQGMGAGYEMQRTWPGSWPV